MAMLPPPPKNPQPCPDSMVLAGEERKTSKLSHVLKGRSELREDRAYDCGCNSWSPLRDAVGSFKKITHPPLEQYITWTRTTQCPTVQTHTPHCMQEDTVRQWFRTVYIPWLVASYDTHKGKRWLNSKPTKPQGQKNLSWD